MYSTREEVVEYCKFCGLLPIRERVDRIHRATLSAEKYNYRLTGNIYGLDWNDLFKMNSKQLALLSGVERKELPRC